MPSTNLHKDFIADLVGVGDAGFAGRVLRKVFDDSGRFIDQAKEDHRYKGIEDAWIRKASKGMRVIYVRDGENITLYRAGQHSVEDNLAAPQNLDGPSIVENKIESAMLTRVGVDVHAYAKATEAAANAEDAGVGAGLGGSQSRLLYNHIDRFLYGNLLGRRFLPHKDVYLVSPFLSADLLRSTDVFGQMLDELIDGGASIWLITRPPVKTADLSFFEGLSARGVNVFFNGALHAKVFAFILDCDRLNPSQKASRDFVAVGSANLTRAGINTQGLLSNDIQYELSYEAKPEDWPDIEKFILHVTGLSTDLDVLRANLASQTSKVL